MKTIYLLLGAGLLAGCQSRPAGTTVTTVTTATPADTAANKASTVAWERPPLPPDTALLAARQAVLRQAVPPADTTAPSVRLPPCRHWVHLGPAQTGNHRYVGTLGGQPVMMELTGIEATAYNPASFTGSYFFEWGGQPHGLTTPENLRTDQPLLVVEQADTEGSDTTGIWQADQRMGPVLTGTWTDWRTRRTTHFILRESYAGAVRYELLDEELHSRDSCRRGEYYRRGFVQATWLHLLGEAARRPALRRLQCPPPHQRRQQLQAELPRPTCEDGAACGIFHSVSVQYNGDNLLSYTASSAVDMGGPYPSSDVDAEHLLDLTTGRECRPEDWLRPDWLPQLRRLFTVYLANDKYGRYDIPDVPGPDKLGTLPPLRLTGLGLAFRLGELGAPHVIANATITVPFTQLAPYVRPGTPLARLVAARTRARP